MIKSRWWLLTLIVPLSLAAQEKEFDVRGFEAVRAVDAEGDPADATARLLDVARGADERLGQDWKKYCRE